MNTTKIISMQNIIQWALVFCVRFILKRTISLAADILPKLSNRSWKNLKTKNMLWPNFACLFMVSNIQNSQNLQNGLLNKRFVVGQKLDRLITETFTKNFVLVEFCSPIETRTVVYRHIQVYSNNVRWLIQVPRIFDIFKKTGAVRHFGDYLNNVFGPVMEASINPEANPELAKFLEHVSGFDSVDDESKPENHFFSAGESLNNNECW